MAKWTLASDKEIVNCVNWAMKNDLQIGHGFIKASVELGRSYDDVYKRWHDVLLHTDLAEMYELRKEIRWLQGRISQDQKGLPVATSQLEPINLFKVSRVLKILEDVPKDKPGWGLEITEEQESAMADLMYFGYDWIRWLMTEREWIIWGDKEAAVNDAT